MFEKTRDFLSIVTMAITDREEVTVTKIEHVRVCEVGILVDFVWVVRSDASLGGE